MFRVFVSSVLRVTAVPRSRWAIVSRALIPHAARCPVVMPFVVKSIDPQRAQVSRSSKFQCQRAVSTKNRVIRLKNWRAIQLASGLKTSVASRWRHELIGG